MWRVEWIQSAVDDLTNLWLVADSALRESITIATHTIDDELQVDPFRQSEAREGDERVLFVYPLGVNIEVDQDKHLVWVLGVWRFRRRGE